MKKDLLNQVSDDNLIELRNVSKEFDGTTVLDNINLSIKKKEFVTLLGPSGCGKLLHADCCLFHSFSSLSFVFYTSFATVPR